MNTICVLIVFETWDRLGAMDVALIVAEYRLFRKHLMDGRKGGVVVIILKDIIQTVLNLLF